MYDTFCVGRDTANNFIRRFVNRRAYSIQAAKPLPNGKFPYFLARDWKSKEPKPLNPDVVRVHLNGDITINLYAINPETQRSKWVADAENAWCRWRALEAKNGQSLRGLKTVYQ